MFYEEEVCFDGNAQYGVGIWFSSYGVHTGDRIDCNNNTANRRCTDRKSCCGCGCFRHNGYAFHHYGWGDHLLYNRWKYTDDKQRSIFVTNSGNCCAYH